MMALFRTLQSKLAASAAVLVLVVLIGWIVPLTPPPKFEAAARIWVQSKVPDYGNQETSSAYQTFMTYFNSPLMTACEVLRSQVVLSEARTKLLQQMPEDQVPSVGTLKAGIAVEPVSSTDIIRIMYHSSDPKVAVEVVQAVIDSFAKLETTQASMSAVQSQTFLSQQLKDAKAELKTINAKIREFQERHGIVDVAQEAEHALRQKADIESSLYEAKAAAQQNQVRKQQLAGKLGISAERAPQAAQLSVELRNDALLTQTRNRLVAVQLEEHALATHLKPEHPRMRQLKLVQDRLQKDLNQRVSEIARRTGTPITGADALHADPVTLDNLAQFESTELTARARQQSLNETLSNVHQRMKRIPESQLEYADLVRGQKVAFERISELEKGIASAKLIESLNTQTPSFRVVDAPEISNVTVPSKRPKILTAGLLGLIFAVGVFFILDRMDPRVRKVNAVLDVLPLPVVGWLPQFSGSQTEHQLEAMHRTRLGLRSIMSDHHKHIVVTSSDAGDGKTTLAAGLALSLAQSGKTVLLIDADTTSASIHTRFKLPVSPGLSDYLAKPDPQLWSKIKHNIAKNLVVIPAGGKAAVSVLSTDLLPQLMKQAALEADVVIYDTPATSESPAALALLSQEVTLLVAVRIDHTHMPDLRILATQLKQHDTASSALFIANVNDYNVAAAIGKADRQPELELV